MSQTLRRKERWRRIAPYAPLIALIVISIAIGIVRPQFLTLFNFTRMATQAAPLLVIALGSTFVVILGSIDLSVEGVMGLVSVALSLLVLNDRNSTDLGLLGVVLAVGCGGLVGLINGLIHTKMRIPSFMATLGMLYVGLGTATVLFGGFPTKVLDKGVRDLALQRFLDLPYVFWIALACVAIAYIIQRYTRIGRYMYAIGGDEDLAKLSGVPIDRYKVIIFVLAGLFAGVGGLITGAQLGVGTAQIADGRLFTSITSVVVGGTALSGGEGGVVNTVIGVAIVTVLTNGMILLGVNPYVQQAVQGLIILGAVAVTINRSRLKIIK